MVALGACHALRLLFVERDAAAALGALGAVRAPAARDLIELGVGELVALFFRKVQNLLRILARIDPFALFW